MADFTKNYTISPQKDNFLFKLKDKPRKFIKENQNFFFNFFFIKKNWQRPIG